MMNKLTSYEINLSFHHKPILSLGCGDNLKREMVVGILGLEELSSIIIVVEHEAFSIFPARSSNSCCNLLLENGKVANKLLALGRCTNV